MIVAMFTNNFLPHVSGIGTAITRLERGLRHRGHHVHIFAPWAPGYHDTQPTVHRMLSLPFLEPWIPLPIPVPLLLAPALRRLHPDILHAHHPFLVGPMAVRLAHSLHRPIVFTYHAMYEEYVHYLPLLPERVLRALAIQRALTFVAQVDAVVAPSASLKDILLARGVQTPISVIPTGVNLTLFRREAHLRDATRAGWKIAPSDMVIVSFGRLSKEKRFDLLLEAMAIVKTHLPSVRLIVGGDGPARAELEQRARVLRLEHNVQFCGFIPHEKVPAFLAGADLFAYTSLSETQGLVTLEAHAAGLPAVVTDAPGNRDIVEHGRSGMVTESSPAAIANGLVTFLNDPVRRAAAAIAARERAEQFSEEQCAERMEALYLSLRR